MERSLFEYIKMYFMMVSQDAKSKMTYRADFIISSLAMLFIDVAGLLSFWLIFRAIPALEGFGYEEMLFIYSFSLITATPMQLFFDNLWQLWISCENGDFIKYCFKPLNLYFYYIAETLDIKGLGQFLFAAVIFIYSWIKIGIVASFANIVILLLVMLGASLVLIGMMTMASASAFICIHGVTILGFVSRFREYARYPVTIFNKVFQFIFTFIIPVAFLAFYPAMYFLRPDGQLLLSLISPLVGIIVFFVGYKVWMRGALKYAGTGS